MMATGNIHRSPRSSSRTRIGKTRETAPTPLGPARRAWELGPSSTWAWAGPRGPFGAISTAAAAPASATRLAVKNASPVAGTYDLAAVACFSASVCIAVGRNAANQGVVVPTTGGTAGAAMPSSSRPPLTSSRWPAQTRRPAWTPGKSTGTPTNGAVVTITSGVPAAAQIVTGTAVLLGRGLSHDYDLRGSRTNVPNEGVLVPVNSGAVGAEAAVSGTVALNAIVCSSTTTCEAFWQ